MSYMEVIAMGAYLVAVWAVCAVAAGAMLWVVGLAGYGVVRTWNWAWKKPEAHTHHRGGRKHGRRVPAAGVRAFVPVSIRRRVFPLV